MIKKIAVENFLGSLDLSIPHYCQVGNVWHDARLYKWNDETIMAILKGIKKAYGLA